MNEQWAPMVDFEGWYEISDLGRIRRVKGGPGTFVGKVLKLEANNRGYWYAQPCKECKRHKFLIHRLVMAAFVGPCPDGIQVNHIDGDKENNRLDNLEYMTQSENMVHGRGLGLFSSIGGEKNGNAILTEENVHEIRRRLKYESPKAIAERFNISRGNIYSIKNGTRWSSLKEEEEEDE